MIQKYYQDMPIKVETLLMQITVKVHVFHEIQENALLPLSCHKRELKYYLSIISE